MSISSPVLTFSRIGPVRTTRGGIGFTPLRISFQRAINSMGAASVGMPTVRPERAGVLIRLAGDAEVWRVIRYAIEQHQRRRLFEGEQFGQRADLQMPVRAMDFLDLTELTSSFDEFPEIVEWHAV